MIKLEKTEVCGWEPSIRGMRNPHNSWDKMDSGYYNQCDECGSLYDYSVGPNDHDLMMRLRNAGTDDRKCIRMIVVYVDITAPLYWWKEFETYRVGVAPNPTDIEMNSCSTMHKIHDKEFTFDDFSHEHLFVDDSTPLLGDIINLLNKARAYYKAIDEEIKSGKLTPNERLECVEKRKQYWWQMIQLLPSSYNQKRTLMLNYEALANMYKSRKGHKLDEWRELCTWIESLPYSEIITGGE